MVDVRVIVLGKSLSLDLKKHYVAVDENTAYVSLGYFDSLNILPLKGNPYNAKDNWLHDVWTHGAMVSRWSSADAYYHPIYIYNNDSETVKDFWNDETHAFTFTTFIHRALDRKSDSFADICKAVTEVAEGIVGVKAVCYRTLNLSNAVAIWRSTSFSKVIECIKEIYGDPIIGDLHTICGLPYDKQCLVKIPDLPSDEKDLEFISMRFSVKDAAAAHDFLDKISVGNNAYMITGVDDIELVLRDVKLGDFTSNVAKWYSNPEVYQKFRKAFNSCATFVGTLNPSAKTRTPNEQQLTMRFNNVKAKFEKWRNGVDFNETLPMNSWVRLISDQMTAFLDMSRKTVLDGFCYLVLDNLEAFTTHADDADIEKGHLTNDALQGIQRFARGLSTLTDLAIRTDGQFTQSPSFSPSLLSVPTTLLEFYLAFAKKCLSYYQMADDEESHNHSYNVFLAPKICRRIKVEDVFAKKPPCDRLLYVDIPIDTLYLPHIIVPHLTHELSHYSGEKYRMRHIRANLFVAACAQFVSRSMGLHHLDVVKTIANDLLSHSNFRNTNTDYMDNLENAVLAALVELCNDSNIYYNWRNIYVSSTRMNNEEARAFNAGFESLRLAFVYTNQSDIIETIVMLFKECYCDISMLHLLELTYNEYVELFCHEFEIINNRVEEDEGSVNVQKASLAQRIAIVSIAMKFDTTPPEAYIGKPFFHLCQLVYVVTRQITNRESTYSCYLPSDVLDTISMYLGECIKTMDSHIINASNVDLKKYRSDIANAYSDVVRNRNIGGEVFCDFITAFEKQANSKLL